MASRVFAARGAAYLTVYAAVFGVVALGPLVQFTGGSPAGGFLDQPVLSHDGVVVVLLVMSLAATAAGLLFRRRALADVERWLWPAASAAFVVTALLLAPFVSDGLTGASVLVLGVSCFAASHLERWPVLYVPAVATVLAGATLAASELLEAVPGAWGSYLPWLAGCAPAAAALYAVRWLRRDVLAADPVRRWSLAAAAHPRRRPGRGRRAVVGRNRAGRGLRSWPQPPRSCCAEVPAAARRAGAELGLFATTAAVQRAVLFTGPDAGSDWPECVLDPAVVCGSGRGAGQSFAWCPVTAGRDGCCCPAEPGC